MNAKRRILLVVFSLVIALSSAGTVFAAGDASTACVQQLINYYRFYQERAATDIGRICEDLVQTDTVHAAAWENIMDFWTQTNTRMDIRSDTLPDGLPEDNSLCIVVLGFQLMPTGSMRGELVGRLKVALEAAQKYPNAYLLCTGGGTARYNSDVTEAGQMAAWLIRKGVDSSRIIIENNSLSTVQNAQYSIALLRSDYPQVKSLAMVTSDYHLRRGSMCFYAQSVLDAYRSGGTLYEICGTAAYQTGQSSESVSSQASDVAAIAGISLSDLPQPSLSRLSYIAVEGQTLYEPGGQLSLMVTAVYDTGYRKAVTALCELSGFDLSRTGTQIVTVKYTENNYRATAAFQIQVALPGQGTDAPQPTEIAEITAVAETMTAETEPEAKKAAATAPSAALALLTAAGVLALFTFFIRKLWLALIRRLK